MDQKQQFNTSNEFSANQSSTAPKNKSQMNSGNYINVVPMAVVNSGVQYHSRRKYPSPQVTSDYSSRIYLGDYIRDRCREDVSNSNSYYSIPQVQNSSHHQHSVATSTNDVEQGGGSNSNSLIITPTSTLQIHQSSQPSNAPSSSNQQQTIAPSVPTSVLYRVVPTNYGNNSNVSTRNESSDGFATSNGSNPSTNTYQQQNQINSTQDASSQLLLHQQQSSNVSNSSSNLIGGNAYGGFSNSTTTGSSTTTAYGSVTNQSIPRPMQKVIPTVVYLMSRIAVHMEIEGTAQCPSQVMLAAALGCEELGISNKLLAQSVFGLWMASSLLEIQLKPHHRPYAVRVGWSNLLEKHTHGNEIEKCADEPMTTLRRNVFYSRRDEEKIKDPRILELLFEEAKNNVLLGRYIMEPAHLIMLGGIQARIELGPYNAHTHTVSWFRENQFRFLPAHIARNSNWSWLPYSRQNSAEVRLLEQFKRVPTTATTRKLIRKYLEFLWALPFYGAAFFHGQVEQPIRGLMSLFQQKDIPVLIAINEKGIYVIDNVECTLLIGLKYEEFSWDIAKPPNLNSNDQDPECLPCLFIQFGAVENSMPVTKLMQIFSRQAVMMDALISHFSEMRRRKDETETVENVIEDEPNPIHNGVGVLSNKFSRLTLATFDDEGRCLNNMGSLSISY